MLAIIEPGLITRSLCFGSGEGLDDEVSRTDNVRSVCKAHSLKLQTDYVLQNVFSFGHNHIS